MGSRVITGDCLTVMPTLDAESVDAIVTDPPYGLSFMGKAWDHGVPGVDFWTAALRVAKPGVHLVAFGGTRTYHRLTCAIEDAGWEIRDCLSWLYGSGFPKSHNGPWGGTALKPAWEPCILARKPLAGTVEGNHAKHGTGALNIDGCRIESAPEQRTRHNGVRPDASSINMAPRPMSLPAAAGRWPANVVLDEQAAGMLDEQSGERPSGALNPAKVRTGLGYHGGATGKAFDYDATTGGASRFFYTAKASRSERNAGLEDRPDRAVNHIGQRKNNGSGGLLNGTGEPLPRKNHHPTVKPLDLMQWLCRLVTPKGGLVLDPFTGSGSTGRAAVAEGFSFLGIELSEEYAAIARARIAEYAPLFQDGAA